MSPLEADRALIDDKLPGRFNSLYSLSWLYSDSS